MKSILVILLACLMSFSFSLPQKENALNFMGVIEAKMESGKYGVEVVLFDVELEKEVKREIFDERIKMKIPLGSLYKVVVFKEGYLTKDVFVDTRFSPKQNHIFTFTIDMIRGDESKNFKVADIKYNTRKRKFIYYKNKEFKAG